MIVDFIVGFVVAQIMAWIQLLPMFDLEFIFNSQGDTLWNWFVDVRGLYLMGNQWFPLDTALQVLLAAVAAMFGFALWHLLVFIYDKFPFKAT